MSQPLPATRPDSDIPAPSGSTALTAVRKVAGATKRQAVAPDPAAALATRPPSRSFDAAPLAPVAASPGAVPAAPRQMTTARLDDIHPGPLQTRRLFTEEGLRALAQSIADKGIAQPLIVRRRLNSPTGFDLIAGYRRWRAARLAGLTDAPVVVLDWVEDDQALELALIENLQRRDLTVLEEAEALQLMIDRHDRTHSQIATLTGRSRSQVTNMLRLLTLPPEVKELLDSGQIGFGQARALLPAKDPVKLARRIARTDMRVRDVERLVAKELGRTPQAPGKGMVLAAPQDRPAAVADTAKPVPAVPLKTEDEDSMSPQRRALENELSELLSVDIAISLTAAKPSVVLQAEGIGQIFEAIRLIREGVRAYKNQAIVDRSLSGDSII